MKTKILSLVLTVMMLSALLSIPAAGAEGVINFDEDPYEVSIQFVGLFEENRNIENVEAALNEITLKKINCTVDIVPVFIGNLNSTISLGVAGDEKLDVVAVGLTQRLSSMVSDELLLPLDDLLEERGQAALEVTANVAAAQKVQGVTYAVTGYPYAASAGGFVYNKTMADAWGIDMHDEMTLQEFTEVGRILKEHDVYLTTHGNSSILTFSFYGGEHFSNGIFGGIKDPVNDTTIENVLSCESMRNYWKEMKIWFDNGYTPADQLTDTTRGQEYFTQQRIFGMIGAYTIGQLTYWVNPNFEVGIVRLNRQIITTENVGEFMLGIASNCERPDKAMDLINLIYSDPDVANLLQYGVEGTDYVAVEGTENVITVEGTANEDHNSYFANFVHYGDPMKKKVLTPLTDSYYDELIAFENEAQVSKTLGYTFDSQDFNAESGAISTILEQKLPQLNAGQVQDVDAYVAELVNELSKAGMDDAIRANQEQLDAFLAGK